MTWAAALSLLTAIAAAGTVALHLVGDVRHRHYLPYWGIDAGMFAKPADWVLVNGYYGVVDRFIVIVGALFANLHWLLGGAAVLGVYLFLLRQVMSTEKAEMPAWLQRKPAWTQRLVACLVLSLAVVAALPFATFLFTAVMVIPAALGESAGKAAAEAELVQYRKGCELSSRSCVQLRRNGEMVVQGFVLDSSATHIALLEAQSLQGRVIPLDAMELVVMRPGLTSR